MIETPRLILRNWRAGDADRFFEHTNTENVMRWLGGVRTRDFIDGVVERLTGWQEIRGFTFWAVERKSDGELLGFCGIKIADGQNSPVFGEYEVGWRFREDSWGQGYAKEAAVASLDHAFSALGAQSVFALTMQENEASWGLMLRLGMRRREDLDYVDTNWPDEMNPVIVYQIAAEEWRA